MGELLLELLSEEIPARMQRRALDDLTGLIRDKLAAADIRAVTLTGYVTPRRLALVADGIPARQPDRNEERRGPRVGAPEQALSGFLRAAGLASIDQCEIRGEFYFAVMKRLGAPTGLVLVTLLRDVLVQLSWPKSMRYPASDLRWVRPVNSVICLFDGAIIKIPLGNVPVGDKTRGHRFLSPGEITVADAADYRAKLAKAHVVLDWHERRNKIEAELKAKAGAAGLTLKDDQALLDEVAGLVEYPVVLMGLIDADFVRPLPDGLPPEVLATAMRTHQKYFTCLNADGTPAPRFLFVANNVTPDNGAAIVAGNERVLRARLSDAKFFWDQDRKVRLEDRVEALKQRVYHEKLGSVYDKVEHLEVLSGLLARRLYDDNELVQLAARAAYLAKADLSSGMVGEFPELQGVMGHYYALYDKEDVRVSEAIAEHYRPAGPGDACPSAPVSVVVALADKFDTLAGFFGVNERPTGSRDPFALRRGAQGLIRIIVENSLRLSLKEVFTAAANLRLDDYPPDVEDFIPDLMEFIVDRLKVHLRDQGIRHDLVSAVVALAEDDLVRLLARVAALGNFLNTDDGANLLTAYRRASNIVEIEEKRDGIHYGTNVRLELLRQPAEQILFDVLRRVSERVEDQLNGEFFESAMIALAQLRRPVDEFFDKVTVNTKETVIVDGAEQSLRENRLRLLTRIRATMNQIADFSQIEG